MMRNLLNVQNDINAAYPVENCKLYLYKNNYYNKGLFSNWAKDNNVEVTETYINNLKDIRITYLAIPDDGEDMTGMYLMHINRCDSRFYNPVVKKYIPKRVYFEKEFNNNDIFDLFVNITYEDYFDYYKPSLNEIKDLLNRILSNPAFIENNPESEIKRFNDAVDDISSLAYNYQEKAKRILNLRMPDIYINNHDNALYCNFEELLIRKEDLMKTLYAKWCEFVFEKEREVLTPVETFINYTLKHDWEIQKDVFKEVTDEYITAPYSIQNIKSLIKNRYEQIDTNKKGRI